MEDFGPHKYGCKLLINPTTIDIHDGPVVFDIETDEKDHLVGIGLCQSNDVVYYFTKLTPSIVSILETHTLIAHGGEFDTTLLDKYGVNVTLESLKYDTRIMGYVMDSSRPKYGLKSLAQSILGFKWPTYKEMVGKGKNKLTLDKQPIEKVARYCGMDALSTFKLYEYFSNNMSEKQFEYFHNIEMPCMRVISKMQNKGINVDVQYLQNLEKTFASEETKLETNLKEYSKDDKFNVRSPKQVLSMLNKNGIKLQSTGADILEEYKDNKVVKLLLQFREISKLKSTYVTSLLKRDGLPRIHARFNQTRTVTGRLSCSKPNLQNIPIRTEKGALLREVFCAAEGHKLVAFDYGQIEYRLFAHHTQDTTLYKIIMDGGDVHENTAMAIFNIKKEQVTKDLRRRAKTINFGIIYGQSVYGLSRELNITEPEAQTLMDLYWNKMPRAASWISVQKWKVHKEKYVETLCGRRIALPLIDMDKALTEAIKNAPKYKTKYKKTLQPQTIAKLLVQAAERRATNFPFQGGSADITKLAMIQTDKAGYTPIIQCHDELLFEVPDTKEEIEKCINTVKPLMENIVKLSIPLSVDYGVGKTWGSAK